MNFFKEKLLVILAGLIITAILSGLFVYQPQHFRNIKYNLYDNLVSKLPQSEPSGLVVIVDIDEKSLAQFGQWPWPRNKVASLLVKLQQMQVLSVAIDFLFAEADRTSLNSIISGLNQTSLSQFLDLKSLSPEILDNDLFMSKSLSSGPFVLGYSFIFEKKQDLVKEAIATKNAKNNVIHPLNVLYLYADEDNKRDLLWYQPKSIISNLEIFSRAVPNSGFFNMSPDHDGLIRKVPLVMLYQDKLYPNLSLATLITAIQAQQVVFKQTTHGVDSFVIDEQKVPVDEHGNFWIHFRDTKESAFETISAADILNNKVPIEQLANRVVILGTSAKGLFDLRSTPYNPIFSGAEVHATLIDNIIRGDFINHPSWSWLAELLLIITAGLVSLVIVLWSRAIINLLLNLFLISLLLIGSWWWLQQDRIYISVLYPIIMVLLNFGILSLIQYRFKEKKLVTDTLEHNRVQKIALADLKQAKDELEVFSNSLELQVKERTQELAEINQHTKESIEYASLIQSALISDPKILKEYFQQSFVIWSPKDIVGGDIYLMEALNENELIIMVIDCTGHGVPGAFVTMLVKAIERQIIANVNQGEEISPAKMLSVFNRNIKLLLKQNDRESVSNAGFDGAILYFNKQQQLCKYSGASTPLFIFQNEQLKMYKGDRYSIGYNSSDNDKIFTDLDISTAEGATIYISTDGYLDQPGGEQKFPFGKKRFKLLLEEISHKPMDEQQQIFIDELKKYQHGNERVDDVTVIGIHVP